MPAVTKRTWGLHADVERPRSSNKTRPSSGLLEIEAQQAEHQASQASFASSHFCTTNIMRIWIY